MVVVYEVSLAPGQRGLLRPLAELLWVDPHFRKGDWTGCLGFPLFIAELQQDECGGLRKNVLKLRQVFKKTLEGLCVKKKNITAAFLLF